MNKKNLILTLITIIVMIGGTWLGVFLVSGNTVDPQTGEVVEKGVLSVNSAPNGAAIYVDGRLQNATNTSIPFLTTGEYDVRLTKEGYIPWEKTVSLDNETVTKIEAILWPATPDPNPLTSTGVLNATLSPDREKLVYSVKFSEDDKAGLWVLDMNRRAVFNNSTTAFTQITRNTNAVDYSQASLIWSPDNAEVLATITDTTGNERNFLIDITRLNTNPPDVTLTKNGLLEQWKEEFIANNVLEEAKIAEIEEARNLITNSTTPVVWSYDKSLFLYTTNGNGTVMTTQPNPTPARTSTPTDTPIVTDVELALPSPAVAAPLQPLVAQSKYDELMSMFVSEYTEGTQIWVYDIKNKKSFELPYARKYYWYPVEEKAEREVQHLLMVEDSALSMIESDGANKSTVYAALFDPKQVFLWSDGGRLIISANYNPKAGSEPNLYTINLR